MKIKKRQKGFIIILTSLLIIGLIIGTFLTLRKNENEENNIQKEENKVVNIIKEDSKSRPIAFTIDNSDDARTLHSGLQKAYLVYEMINYADGRTRFLALYKDSDVSKVGPIRSTRHYHLDYVLENDAILAHWGQSTIANTNLAKLKIDHINGITYGSDKTKDNIESNRYFWTDKNSKVDISHRRFTNMELIYKAIEKLKIDKETDTNNLFKYSAVPLNLTKIDNKSTANKIDIYFSNSNYVTYEYDKEGKVYKRSVKGKEHIDNLTNEQITVKNIIVYKIKNYTIAGNPDILQELENVGSGDGYYITNGYAINIKWQKECHSCQTKYTYLDGSEIILNDGNTFIEIMPTSKELKIS